MSSTISSVQAASCRSPTTPSLAPPTTPSPAPLTTPSLVSRARSSRRTAPIAPLLDAPSPLTSGKMVPASPTATRRPPTMCATRRPTLTKRRARSYPRTARRTLTAAWDVSAVVFVPTVPTPERTAAASPVVTMPTPTADASRRDLATTFAPRWIPRSRLQVLRQWNQRLCRRWPR